MAYPSWLFISLLVEKYASVKRTIVLVSKSSFIKFGPLVLFYFTNLVIFIRDLNSSSEVSWFPGAMISLYRCPDVRAYIDAYVLNQFSLACEFLLSHSVFHSDDPVGLRYRQSLWAWGTGSLDIYPVKSCLGGGYHGPRFTSQYLGSCFVFVHKFLGAKPEEIFDLQ